MLKLISSQWYASTCVIIDSLGKRCPWFFVFICFHGVNICTWVDFKLPNWHHWTQYWERITTTNSYGYTTAQRPKQTNKTSRVEKLTDVAAVFSIALASGKEGGLWLQVLFLLGLPRWFSGKESTCQFRKHEFDPWVRRIPWRREWLSTPLFLPGESHGQRSLVGYSPWSHRE